MSPAGSSIGWIRPTPLTIAAAVASACAVAFSAAFVATAYPNLPDLLPVRFGPRGSPIGWQYKTPLRALMPVFVQGVLALSLGALGALLLSRSHRSYEDGAPDVRTASVAAECVALITLIWVAFQAYGAYALVRMWEGQGDGLGQGYTYLQVVGVALTVAVTIRARRRLAAPGPRSFVPGHWRMGQLYRNPEDPALFVPTRDGSRWTLNFGRPVAVFLLAVVLGIGIVVPTLILALLLR